jgi:hypothetical protein
MNFNLTFVPLSSCFPGRHHTIPIIPFPGSTFHSLWKSASATRSEIAIPGGNRVQVEIPKSKQLEMWKFPSLPSGKLT